MRFFIIILTLLISCEAQASWYVFSQDNEAIAKVNYRPSIEDLESRNEFSFESKEDIDLRYAEYFQGKVRKRPLTQKEKEDKKIVQERKKESDILQSYIMKEALKKAKEDGKSFKYIKEEDL